MQRLRRSSNLYKYGECVHLKISLQLCELCPVPTSWKKQTVNYSSEEWLIIDIERIHPLPSKTTCTQWWCSIKTGLKLQGFKNVVIAHVQTQLGLRKAREMQRLSSHLSEFGECNVPHNCTKVVVCPTVRVVAFNQQVKPREPEDYAA